MVKALDNLPVSVSIVKKSKIGKAINQIYKAQIFDSYTNEIVKNLVDKWKRMVKEAKEEEKNYN